VSAFAEDSKGNIWMGLYAGGLYRYDGRQFKHFQKSDGVPGGTISALLAEGDGLWVGSNAGLGRVENTGDDRLRVEIYNAARGMSSNNIVCITSDLQGRIYACTGKGVDRLEPKPAISATSRPPTAWRTARLSLPSAIGRARSGLRQRKVCRNSFHRRLFRTQIGESRGRVSSLQICESAAWPIRYRRLGRRVSLDSN